MSEAILTEKPVIDAVAEGAAETPGAAVQDARGEGPPAKRGTAWLVLWLLLLSGALAGGLWYLWHQVQQTRQGLASAQQTLSQQVDAVRHRVDELGPMAQRIDGQSSNLSALQARQQSLEDALGTLRNDISGTARVWDVEQIAVLLEMANDRLRLSGELGPSLAALQAADRHLQRLKNPGLLEVRRRLADEINALEAAPNPDVPGLALNLEALINGIDRLPVAQGEALATAATTPEERPTGWRAAIRDLWENVKALVVIKHRGQADRPLLAPDERYFLRQNLRLELEAARVALLRRDNQSYQTSLRQAREWISQYFDEQAPAAAAALAELARLQQTDIAPPLPDISASLDTLLTWLDRQKRAPTPASAHEGKAAP